MKTEKAAEAFTAETVSMQLFSRLSLLTSLPFLPRAALLCALLMLGAAAPLSETHAQAPDRGPYTLTVKLLKEPGGTEEATTTAVYVPLYFEVELNQPARSDLKVEGHFTHTTTPGAPATVRPAYILQGQTTGSGLVVPGENLGEYLFGIASVLFTDGGGGEPMLPSPSTRLVTVEAGIIQGVGWNFEEIDPDETRITLAEGSTVGVVFQLGTIGDPNSDQGNTVWPVALHKGRPTSALRFTPPSVTPTYDTHELTVGSFIIEAVDDGIPEPEQEITFEFEVRNGGRDGELAGYSLFFGTVTIPANEMSDTPPVLTLRLTDKRPFYEIGQPVPFELRLDSAAESALTVMLAASTTNRLAGGMMSADPVTIPAGESAASGFIVIDISDLIPLTAGPPSANVCSIQLGPLPLTGESSPGWLSSGLRNAVLHIVSASFADGADPPEWDVIDQSTLDEITEGDPETLERTEERRFDLRALPLTLRLAPVTQEQDEGGTAGLTLSVERENLRCYVDDSEDKAVEVTLEIIENAEDGAFANGMTTMRAELSLTTPTADVPVTLTDDMLIEPRGPLTVKVTRVDAEEDVIDNNLTNPETSFLDERTTLDGVPVEFPEATVNLRDDDGGAPPPMPPPMESDPYTLSLKLLEEPGGTAETTTATVGLPLWFELELNQPASSNLHLRAELRGPEFAFAPPPVILAGRTTASGFVVPRIDSDNSVHALFIFEPMFADGDDRGLVDLDGEGRHDALRGEVTVLPGSGVDIRVFLPDGDQGTTLTAMVGDIADIRVEITRPVTAQEDMYHLRLFAWESSEEREVIAFSTPTQTLTIPSGQENPIVRTLDGEVLAGGSSLERIIDIFAELREDGPDGDVLGFSGRTFLTRVVVPASDMPPLPSYTLTLRFRAGQGPVFDQEFSEADNRYLVRVPFELELMPANPDFDLVVEVEISSGTDSFDTDRAAEVTIPAGQTTAMGSVSVIHETCEESFPSSLMALSAGFEGLAPDPEITVEPEELRFDARPLRPELSLEPQNLNLDPEGRYTLPEGSTARWTLSASNLLCYDVSIGDAVEVSIAVDEDGSDGDGMDDAELSSPATVELSLSTPTATVSVKLLEDNLLQEPREEITITANGESPGVDTQVSIFSIFIQADDEEPTREEVTMTLGTADTSVLIPSMHDAQLNLAQIFVFTLTDAGADGLSWVVEAINFSLRGADSTLRALRGDLQNEGSDIVMRYSGVDTSATPAPRFIVSHNGFGAGGTYQNRVSDTFYLEVWLDPSAGVADGSTFTVSIASEDVTLEAGDERSAIVPNQMLSSGEISVDVQPEELMISSDADVAPIYTYSRPAGVSSAVDLLFSLLDEHGNRDLNTPADELELVSLQVNGAALSFNAADVQIVSTEPSTFTLTVSRIAEGGAEGGGQTLDLTVRRTYDSGGGTIQRDLEETVSGVVVDVFGNTLVDADEDAPADFDSAMLTPGETASLTMRYQILGCVDPAAPDAACADDSSNPLAVFADSLSMDCDPAANCQSATLPPFPSEIRLDKDPADGSFFEHVIDFTVPRTVSGGAQVELSATWRLRVQTVGGSAVTVNSDSAATTASAQILGDTVSPTGPADFAEDLAQRQAYQFTFSWSAAMDRRIAGGDVILLTSTRNYSILYADPPGVCPAPDDPAYSEATNAVITAGANPATDGFTAVVGDTFDGSEKITADSSYCIALETDDGVTEPVRTARINAITAEYRLSDGDGDGLPDALAPLCGSCGRVADKTGDSDGDGINNVLESYLSEKTGASSNNLDAYNDAGGKSGVPDILELRYGAFDDRTDVPDHRTAEPCHAVARATRADVCGVADMRLLIAVNDRGDGVYKGHAGVVVSAAATLTSGTHWLLDASGLVRLDIRPLATLSEPPQTVQVTEGELTAAQVTYPLSATVEGFYPLGGNFFLQYLTDSSSVIPVSSVTGENIISEGPPNDLRITLNFGPALTRDPHDGQELKFIIAVVGEASISNRSFESGSTTRLRTVRSRVVFVGREDIELSAGMNDPAQLDLAEENPQTQALEFIAEDLGTDGFDANLNGRSMVFTLAYSGGNSDAQEATANRLKDVTGVLVRVREGQADVKWADYAVDPADSSKLIPQADLTGASFVDGTSATLRLSLQLSNPTGMVEGDWLDVSLDPGAVTPGSGSSRIIPGNSISNRVTLEGVTASALALSAPGVNEAQALIYTYGAAPASMSTLMLSFRGVDERGNIDRNLAGLNPMISEILIDGVAATLDGASFAASPGAHWITVLTAQRVTGGGSEGPGRTVQLSLTADGITTPLTGTAGGFTVDVRANTLADPMNENMRSGFVTPLLVNEEGTLRLRYRTLGCVTAGDLSDCASDGNDNLAVTVSNLQLACTAPPGETCTAPTLDAAAFTLGRDESFLAGDVEFSAPDTLGVTLMADWELMGSLTVHAQATTKSSATVVDDTVPPVPPPGGLSVTDTQPYRVEFRWDAAMDQRTADTPAMPLDSPDNYRVLYAEPVSGSCPAEDDAGYARATNTMIPAAADPAADGFTAFVEDAFDGSAKIAANTAWCFTLEVTDGANSTRTAPVSAMTPEYDPFTASDGLPDHLAPVCSACDGLMNGTGDDDNDGINNVLEAYLAEEDADSSAIRSDAYSDGNRNNIPDILELHYGALDERTTAPKFDTVTCHASAWQTPAGACRDEDGNGPAGMHLLIEMNSEGEGVYTGNGRIGEADAAAGLSAGVLVDANTWLGSGTHWLMGADQLMRLDIHPLLSLSGPAEIAVTPGARASAGYAAKLSLQGPIALSGGSFGVQVQMQATFPDSESGMPTVSPESVTIDEASGAQSVQVNLPTLAGGDDGHAVILAAVPDVDGSTRRISRHSFDDGAMTLSLRSLLTSVHLLDSTPLATSHAIIPHLTDGTRAGTPRIGSVASWLAGADPNLDEVLFSCVEVPGVLADPVEGESISDFIQFTLAEGGHTVPSAPVLAHARFYNEGALTVADCGSSEAADHLLGQLAFLAFPVDSEDEDRDGNLVPDSQEGGPRGEAGDSGAAGLRYEAADGAAAYYLRSPGRGLRLGARAQGGGTPNLLESMAVGPAELEPPIPDILTVVDDLVLDFEAYCADSPNCMQAGARVQFVFQVSVDIPPEVQYYKLADTNWCPMRADYGAAALPPASLGCPDPHEAGLRDGLGFAPPDADGVCPPLGSAAYAVAADDTVTPAIEPASPWLDVPRAGDRCVQLSITNGGSNDHSDGVSNIVSDPGFLGVERGGDPEVQVFTDGGGGGSIGLPALLLLGLLTLLSVCGMLGMRRAGFSASRTLPAVGCALLLALAPAQAEAQEPAWLPDAVSAAAGATFLDPDTASAFEVDDDEDSGWRLGVEWLWRDGVQLLPALPESDLFVELSYADLGEATVCLDTGCTDDSEHEVEYEVWSLGARSVWDWSHELAPWLGKPFAGVGYRYGRSNEDMGEKNGFYWNAGFEWELGRTAAERGFSLRVFYEAYDADAGAVWAGLAWHPRTERRVAADKPRRPQVKRERVERRPAERRRAPTLMDGQCPVSVEDACACLEPVGRSPAGWYVQVIAYSQRARAQQMRDRLAREGLRRLGLRTLSGSRGVVHAVRVASPRSCSAAMEIKERVDGMLEVNALVRPWYQSPW